MADRVLDRRAIAAGAAVVALLVAMVLAWGVSSGATSARELAASGEARAASLTVAVPAAVTDRIYAGAAVAGRPIVVIDAGHGGQDPGATSVSGEVDEKDLTLALARELRDLLVERGRVRVAMTRDDDRYLSLDQRAAVARRLGASLFVSIHVDSAPNPLARGATVYSLADVASDDESAHLAAEHNGSAAVAGAEGSAAALLSDLALRDQMSASADFATRLVGKSAGRFELRPEPHRFADFQVLRETDAPAVLFEGGYISNADDELLLRSPEHRSALALALAQAIEADVAARARH